MYHLLRDVEEELDFLKNVNSAGCDDNCPVQSVSKIASTRFAFDCAGGSCDPIPSNIQRQLQMQSEAIASIGEMMLGMVKEKDGKARLGAAYHAREDEEEENEVIDHSFHGKRGFTRVSRKHI